MTIDFEYLEQLNVRIRAAETNAINAIQKIFKIEADIEDLQKSLVFHQQRIKDLREEMNEIE